MKIFKISFNFEADDTWSKADVKGMVDTVMYPIYHLSDVSIGELNIEEIEVEE